MRHTSLTRRSVALAAATALVSGGLAVAAAPAFAVTAAHLSTISASAWDNRSTASLTITGSNFLNGDPTGETNDEVDLVPVHPDVTNEVGTIVAFADTASPPNNAKLTVKIPLAMAPPGAYKVRVVHFDGTPSDNTLDFSIYSFGPANATSVAFGPNASSSSADNRGARPLDIRGSNIAVGAKVAFLKKDGTEDGGLHFRQGNPGNDENPVGTQGVDGKDDDSGYPSTTLLQGNYDYDTGPGGAAVFTPGLHTLRVYNTDEVLTGAGATPAGGTTLFSQPYFLTTGVSPQRIGVGAQGVTLTITGQGFRPGSSISVSATKCGGVPGGFTATNDVSVGSATVDPASAAGDGTYTKISAPVSFTSCAATGSRTVSVNGPDGATYALPGGLTVGGAPHITSVEAAYRTLGQGASVGYGSDGVWQPGEGVVVQGTDFVGQGVPAPPVDQMTSFDFGPGVTVITRSVGSGSALVTIDVAPGAPVGDRTVRATNPDGGSTTTGADILGNPPFAVEAGPKADTVSPAGFEPSQPGTEVTVKGSFLTDHTYNVSVNRQAGTVNIGTVTTPDASTLKFTMSTNNAAPGPMDLTITDADNLGRAVCSGCMGINSLRVSAVNSVPVVVGTGSAPNTGPATLTFEATDALGKPLTSGANAIVALTRQVPLNGQGPITGTGVTAAVANKANATFDLTNAAPGKYNGTIVDGANVWTCTGCFTVTSSGNVTIASVTPAAAGQGVTNRLITVTGTHFTQGIQVEIPDVLVHDLVLDPTSPTTKLTFKVDVADDASTSPNPKTMTVIVGDGSNSPTGSKATHSFAVNPKPTNVGGISPSSLAQGAGSNGTPVPFSLTADAGTLQSGVVVTMGPGIAVTTTKVTPGCTPSGPIDLNCQSATPDKLDGTIVVGQGAVADKRNVVVTNPDGGTSTVLEGFTVAPGPKVVSAANELGRPALPPDGVEHTITILGSGFLTDPKTEIKILKLDGTEDSDIQYTPSSATVEPGKIVLKVKTLAAADTGARRITATNTDALKGFGSCNTCLFVMKPPSAPTNLHLTGGAGSLTATWSAPVNNGSTITQYHATIQKAGTTAVLASKDVSGAVQTVTFDGLTNGVTYIVRVQAVNAAGVSGYASASGVAGLATSLAAITSSKVVTAGSGVTFSGRLYHGSVGVPGRTIRLTIDPYVGSTIVRTVTTNSSGAWAYRYYPRYHFAVRPYFAGDSTYSSAVGPLLKVTVPARVTRTSPSNGSSSSSATTLTIKGTVFPSHPGVYVYLYRYSGSTKTLINKVKLSSTSTFTFTGKPRRGTYTFRVYIPATTGNSAAYSSAFTIYRT